MNGFKTVILMTVMMVLFLLVGELPGCRKLPMEEECENVTPTCGR
jgi:hypothetical protein